MQPLHPSHSVQQYVKKYHAKCQTSSSSTLQGRRGTWCEVVNRFAERGFRIQSHSLTPSLTHSPTHSLTHSRTHALTHALTHSRTHSLTHSPARSLPHSHSLTRFCTKTQTRCLTRSRTYPRDERLTKTHEASTWRLTMLSLSHSLTQSLNHSSIHSRSRVNTKHADSRAKTREDSLSLTDGITRFLARWFEIRE